MKRTILLLAIAMMGSSTLAGVRNITSAESVGIDAVLPSVKGPEHWGATVRRGGGQPVSVKNLGDRFASVFLSRGEEVEVCVSIPGLPAGERVQLASTHGGVIDGHPRAEWMVREEGRFCFPYTVGVMGPHPVIVTVRGRSLTLLFQVEEEVIPKEQREAAVEGVQ